MEGRENKKLLLLVSCHVWAPLAPLVGDAPTEILVLFDHRYQEKLSFFQKKYNIV